MNRSTFLHPHERHMGVMGSLADDMSFLRELAHAGKVAQGRFIARRN